MGRLELERFSEEWRGIEGGNRKLLEEYDERRQMGMREGRKGEL